MEIFVATIHVIVALFMILVVLIQGGNQGGIGAAFGGGNTQGVFGASGATSFLGKLTYAAAMIFMTTSVALAIIQGKGGEVGLSDKLKAKSQAEQPAAVDQADDEASDSGATGETGVSAGEDAAGEPSQGDAAEDAAAEAVVPDAGDSSDDKAKDPVE